MWDRTNATSLLFAGLLMNYDRVAEGLRWMLTLSFFHAAYEALLVNELRYLQLIEHKFGLDIQVPSATSECLGEHARAFRTLATSCPARHNLQLAGGCCDLPPIVSAMCFSG